MANVPPNIQQIPLQGAQNYPQNPSYNQGTMSNTNQYNNPVQPINVGLKQSSLSNSPQNVPGHNSVINRPANSIASSSPAFNKPTSSQGNLPPMPLLGNQYLPNLPLNPNLALNPALTNSFLPPNSSALANMRPPMSNTNTLPNFSQPPTGLTNHQAGPPMARPPVNTSQFQSLGQINSNMPPLNTSSQPLRPASSGSQPLFNGPSRPVITAPGQAPFGVNNYPPTSQPVVQNAYMQGPPRPQIGTNNFTGPPGRPPMLGPPTSIPSNSASGPPSLAQGLPSGPPLDQPPMPNMPGGPPTSRQSMLGPSVPLNTSSQFPTNAPLGSLPQGPGLNSGPTGVIKPGLPMNGPSPNSGSPYYNQPHLNSGLMNGPPGGLNSGPPLSGPPQGGLNSGPTGYPPPNVGQTMQNRYPAQPLNSQIPPLQPPGQYGTGNVTQQMGQMSVSKSGFDQMWGHHMYDLLQCRHILPEYPEEPPEITLQHQFAESDNCSTEIFRCTVNRIPESSSLLQKSRLPLGILIHPFKDLNHLPVIQCTSIVRCRACRTYINPFVYFVDSKRWKCNLCYRVNDLPEEFQYDPVSKSYGDPTRRPEIKSATIEFIAPGEYMLRPPQPAVYLFLLDVSQLARESGYLQIFCETLKSQLDQLPGDARTQVGFVCYDTNVHFYLMGEGLTRPREMTVIDIEDIFLPSPESLLVNLGERRELIDDLLDVLPRRHGHPGVAASALGSALQAAYKLMAATGGRVTVFQTCLPNVGPGALTSREDPNARSSKDVAHLNPATDFYKRLALDCSGAQIAVDLFLVNSQYSDLATLSGMSKFSGGSVYHVPLFKSSRSWQADQLRRMLTRYLTRKIGFEAVMRVRCTRGIAIHTFHGNFFVRSTDLLSLPNVSPDSGFGMQLTIEESLSDLQQVCFQAALLYTSSKGERRIRVHTLCLPVANNLTDVLHSADQQCIIGLLSKMAVDRCASASLGEAREALMTVAVDALAAHRLAQNLPAGPASSALHAPGSLRLLPLYLLALLKHRAFRTGTSTRLDDRVAAMCEMKSLPLSQLMRSVYPDLYPIHNLAEFVPQPAPDQPPPDDDDEISPDPPRLNLSAERVNSTGAYLLDDGDQMIIYVGHAASAMFLSDTFGVTSFNQIQDEARSLPKLDTVGNALLHAFIDKLNDERPYASNILVLRDNSPSRLLFTERLVDDRVESAFSYYEFLQHIKSQIK